MWSNSRNWKNNRYNVNIVAVAFIRIPCIHWSVLKHDALEQRHYYIEIITQIQHTLKVFFIIFNQFDLDIFIIKISLLESIKEWTLN